MKSKTKKIKCANRNCGKLFAPKTANAKYCCPKCKAAVKNAKKRADRKSAKAKATATANSAPKKACKVVSVQKIILPKKPTAPTTAGQNLDMKRNAEGVRRDDYLLMGLSLTLLVNALMRTYANIRATLKPISVKSPGRKA